MLMTFKRHSQSKHNKTHRQMRTMACTQRLDCPRFFGAFVYSSPWMMPGVPFLMLSHSGLFVSYLEIAKDGEAEDTSNIVVGFAFGSFPLCNLLEGTYNAVLGLTVTRSFAACVAAAMNCRIGWYFALVILVIAIVFYTLSCVSMLVSLRTIEREGEAVGILLLATANTVLLVLPSLFICLLMIRHRREILSILYPNTVRQQIGPRNLHNGLLLEAPLI